MILWVKRGRDFYSSPDGRFDLFASSAEEDRTRGVWVAFDWEAGLKFKEIPRLCGEWCETREKDHPTTLTAAPHAA